MVKSLYSKMVLQTEIEPATEGLAEQSFWQSTALKI